MPPTDNPTLASLAPHELFSAIASTEPTPGGGGATALCGYLGIALILKAIRISAKHAGPDPTLADADTRLNEWAPDVLKLADADAAAFQTFIQALRLPHTNPAEQQQRRNAMDAAAAKSAATALTTLETGNAIESLAAQITPKIAPNILPDLSAGRQLIAVMSNVAMQNARADVDAIKSPELKSPIETRYQRALSTYQGKPPSTARGR